VASKKKKDGARAGPEPMGRPPSPPPAAGTPPLAAQGGGFGGVENEGAVGSVSLWTRRGLERRGRGTPALTSDQRNRRLVDIRKGTVHPSALMAWHGWSQPRCWKGLMAGWREGDAHHRRERVAPEIPPAPPPGLGGRPVPGARSPTRRRQEGGQAQAQGPGRRPPHPPPPLRTSPLPLPPPSPSGRFC